MDSRLRACDRCAALKAQCSEEAPCGRCRRLGFRCTHNRPVRARGRPRKTGSSTSASRLRTAATPTADGIGEPSLCQSPTPQCSWLSRQLPIDASVASEVLDQVFNSVHRIGILSAFRRDHHKIVAARGPSRDSCLVTSCAVQSVLLVCGLLLGPVREGSKAPAQTCRDHALADIPVPMRESRPIGRWDAYCLYILANLGFLKEETTEIALRWAALADCLDGISSAPTNLLDDELAEVDRRVTSLLKMNNHVQRLLYNRPHRDQAILSLHTAETLSSGHAIGLDEDDAFKPQQSDHEWHQFLSTEVEDSGGGLGCDHRNASEGFFELFLPLRAPFRVALASPPYDSVAYRAAVDYLEEYFVSFPTRLMELSGVDIPWQFEAMIWFHGIYILLSAGADFLEIMLDSEFLRSPAYTCAADHAVLMGDILQHLIAATLKPSQLSHATIFFIALSATIHSSLLPLMYLERPPVPHVLLESARAHEKLLEVILGDNRTCDHPLIRATQKILSFHIQRACEPASSGETRLAEFLQSLKYYRWISEGRGLIKLDDDTAVRLLRATMGKFQHNPVTSNLPAGLLTVFDPNHRICQPGTFDLSILY